MRAKWRALGIGRNLKAASEGVRPKPARGEKKTDEEAMEAVRLGAKGVSSTSGACTDVVMRTGASGFCTSPSMPSTCNVVSNSCVSMWDQVLTERGWTVPGHSAQKSITCARS